MLSITTQPYAEPLHRDEVKTYSRITSGTADDKLIDRLIASARRHVENFTHRQLICATWTLAVDRFPAIVWGVRAPAMQPLVLDNLWFRPGVDSIHLNIGPVASVSSLKYLDTTGTQQTLATDRYFVDTVTEPGRVTPVYGSSWPAALFRVNAVQVQFVAGYAAPLTADAAANTVTIKGRTYSNGDIVRLSNSGGDLPGGLSANTDYYVISSSNGGATFSLATTSNGSAIDITTAGTGQSYVGVVPDDLLAAICLIVGDLYEHRESQTEYKLEDNKAVQSLLYPYRVFNVMDLQ
jgi:hypothetical protein